MRIVRPASFTKVLLPILLAPILAGAQQKGQVTPQQADKAVREIEKLAQKEIHENALPGLTIGPDGKATQVLVENLNVRGEGSFKRLPAQK